MRGGNFLRCRSGLNGHRRHGVAGNHHPLCFYWVFGSSRVGLHFAEIIFGKGTADFLRAVPDCNRGILSGFYCLFRESKSVATRSRSRDFFAVFGLVGIRVPVALIVGYSLHGIWDVLHEIHAHRGGDLFGGQVTDLPLAYGTFCAAFDWCVTVYFWTRRSQWNAAWVGR